VQLVFEYCDNDIEIIVEDGSELAGDATPLVGPPSESVNRTKARDDALYMGLNAIPVGDAAVDIVGLLSARGSKLLGRSYRPTRPFMAAMGAVLSDLLKGARIEGRGVFRLMGVESFEHLAVGYHATRKVIETLYDFGFVEKRKGYWDIDEDGVVESAATRFWPTPFLLALLEGWGVTPDDRRGHFKDRPRPKAIRDPILLRATGKRKKGARLSGVPMPVNYNDPDIVRMAAEVNELNAFTAEQELEGAEHWAFRRIFAEGDKTQGRCVRGGRTYSVGDSYQHDPADDRLHIRINGAPVAEADIGASFLRILHAKAGVPIPPTVDPYLGIPGVPRGVAKAFVAMTLGHDRFHKNWTPQARARMLKKDGIDLQDYPNDDVRAAVLDRIPLLQGWPESPIRWGALQFIESNAVVGAMLILMRQHRIASLPVHDSLILPAQFQEIGVQVLSDPFLKFVGARPMIKVKSHLPIPSNENDLRIKLEKAI